MEKRFVKKVWHQGVTISSGIIITATNHVETVVLHERDALTKVEKL